MKKQNFKLRFMISFCYNNIPFYRKLFRSLDFQPSDIRERSDLYKLPILTKEIINENFIELTNPQLNRSKYYIRSTGGTSGTPLRYILSKYDRFLGGAIIYRHWSRGGYFPGDPVVTLGGTSIVPTSYSDLKIKMFQRTKNIRYFSSFNLDEKAMQKIFKEIVVFRPYFLRGYPSSIYHFSEWLKSNSYEIPSFKAIFTTSEMLFPKVRGGIERNFNTRVFDTYGAGDGGVSTGECKFNSIHIDMERSILEIISENGENIANEEGKIIVTNLVNFAMPLIRYEVGDLGITSDEFCKCGRKLPLLERITGRTVSIFKTPSGEAVHGWFFLYIFWDYGEGIKQYKVIQKRRDSIDILIIPGKNFDRNKLKMIKKIINRRCKDWTVNFQLVDEISKPKSGKMEFIVSYA